MIDFKSFSKASLGIVIFTLFAACGSAMAQEKGNETQWEKSHSRRDQVNDRLENQNKRINKEMKEGEISKAEKHKLQNEDKKIRQEERDMASTNGGHITKSEQNSLNQQENTVSKQIGQ